MFDLVVFAIPHTLFVTQLTCPFVQRYLFCRTLTILNSREDYINEENAVPVVSGIKAKNAMLIQRMSYKVFNETFDGYSESKRITEPVVQVN